MELAMDLVPMLRNFNETARYVDQGGGKRNGSFAIYLSPEHPDIEAWLRFEKRIQEMKTLERGIYSMVYGFRICSCCA